MRETHKFFYGLREDEDSIFCYAKVGGVTVSVSDIDKEKQRVLCNPHADIRDYQRTKAQPFMGGTLSTRSVGYVGSMPGWLSVHQDHAVTHDGKSFVVRVVNIGEETQAGVKQAFCEIVVEEDLQHNL